MRKSMYSALAVLTSMCFSTDAGAQTFICVDCRGAFLHPKDFGNFVFNAFLGGKAVVRYPGCAQSYESGQSVEFEGAGRGSSCANSDKHVSMARQRSRTHGD
jgi:hypothetical protein